MIKPVLCYVAVHIMSVARVGRRMFVIHFRIWTIETGFWEIPSTISFMGLGTAFLFIKFLAPGSGPWSFLRFAVFGVPGSSGTGGNEGARLWVAAQIQE